jgi:hypothetical protein
MAKSMSMRKTLLTLVGRLTSAGRTPQYHQHNLLHDRIEPYSHYPSGDALTGKDGVDKPTEGKH